MKHILLILTIMLTAAAGQAYSQIGHWEKLKPKNNPGPRQEHGLASIGNKKALLFGGYYGDTKNDTWLFDLETNEWQEIKCKNKPSTRMGFGMVQISEKRVLLFGGADDSYNMFNDLWCFDLDSMDWHELIPNDSIPVHPAYRAGMAVLNENEVLVFGGESNYYFPYLFDNQTFIFNIKEKKWDFKNYMISNYHVEDPYITNFGIDSVLLFGGYNFENSENEQTRIFYGKQRKWIGPQVIKPKELRASSGAIVYIPRGGIALLFRGLFYYFNKEDRYQDTAWIYIKDNNEWKALNLDYTPPGRLRNRMTLIDSNKVLLYGGAFKNKHADDTWIFTLDSLKTDVETNPRNHKNKPYVYLKNKIAIIEHNFINNFSIIIVSLIGKVVFSKDYLNEGYANQVINISLENELSGVYLLQINAGSEVCTHKLLIN